MTELSHCSNGALTVLWVGAMIASVICAVLIYSIVSFRSAPANGAATFVHRTAMEVIWAVIPILILISTAMPAISTLVTAENSCKSAVSSATDLR